MVHQNRGFCNVLLATGADFYIPARYGVRQTIGDSLGIGGIFRGLQTIPVVTALARDMEEVCPDALPAVLQQPHGHAAVGRDAPLDLSPAHELASLFIHSLETGTERGLHVNIRNGGLIASLPDRARRA